MSKQEMEVDDQANITGVLELEDENGKLWLAGAVLGERLILKDGKGSTEFRLWTDGELKVKDFKVVLP